MEKSLEVDLHNHLLELLSDINDNIGKYKSDGVLVSKEIYGYIPQVKFDPERSCLVNDGFRPFSRQIWEISDFKEQMSLDRERKGYYECINLIKQIYTKYLDESYFDHAESHLHGLIRDAIIINFDKNKLDHLIDCFIDMLKRARIDSKIKIFIYGICPLTNLELGNIDNYWNIKIRKSEPRDFEIELPFGIFENWSERQEYGLPENTSCIMEFTLKNSGGFGYFLGIEGEIERLIDILRLYRLGRVVDIKYIAMDVGTGEVKLGPSYSNKKFFKTLEYEINTNDIDELTKFITSMKSTMPIDIKYNSSSGLSYLNIAIKWYEDALLYEYDQVLRNEMIVLAIATAITSLSSLYTNTIAGSKRNLINRLETLYKLNIQDTKHLRKFVGEAYGMRSYVTHGSKLDLSKDHIDFLKDFRLTNLDFYNAIIDYNRKSILFFINQEFSKDEILAFLDKSYFVDKMHNLDIVGQKRLKEAYGENLIDYNIKCSDAISFLSYFL